MSHKCEEEGCTSTQTEAFELPVVEPGEESVVWFCYEHAIENGFCIWCNHFGAGSEDYDFSGHKGFHRDCYEALQYETGELDEGDDWDYYPADWYRPGSAESELEPPETPREFYIGPGSEYEQGNNDDRES
jgi:hypothetical protein